MAQENEFPSNAFRKFTRKGLSPNVPAQNLKERSLFARVSFFFFLVLDSNIPTHCRLEQQTYYMIYQEWVITTAQDAYRNGKYKARYLFILSSRFAHYRGDKRYIVRTQLCFKFAKMNISSELVLPLLSTN